MLLPSGLGLKIDQADVGRAGFVRCLPNGCVAEVVMDDNLVKQMRTGQTATFIIFQTPEEGIGFPDEPQGIRRRLRQAAVGRADLFSAAFDFGCRYLASCGAGDYLGCDSPNSQPPGSR